MNHLSAPIPIFIEKILSLWRHRHDEKPQKINGTPYGCIGCRPSVRKRRVWLFRLLVYVHDRLAYAKLLWDVRQSRKEFERGEGKILNSLADLDYL